MQHVNVYNGHMHIATHSFTRIPVQSHVEIEAINVRDGETKHVPYNNRLSHAHARVSKSDFNSLSFAIKFTQASASATKLPSSVCVFLFSVCANKFQNPTVYVVNGRKWSEIRTKHYQGSRSSQTAAGNLFITQQCI
jgi:hypothetical protein